MAYKFSNCLHCQTEFRYCDARSTGKYCNNTCQAKHRTITKTNPRVESGVVHDSRTLRDYLIRANGPTCVECGIEPTWNGKPLVMHVDHIDGNSDNNYPANLRLLCPNCHSQTDTFCARNFKNTERSNKMRNYRKVVVRDGIEPPTFSV